MPGLPVGVRLTVVRTRWKGGGGGGGASVVGGEMHAVKDVTRTATRLIGVGVGVGVLVSNDQY